MDYYQVLGIERNATKEQIKRAYLLKAKECHPDKGGDADQFQKIQKAYEVLYGETSRYFYDTTGSEISKDDIEYANNQLSSLIIEVIELNNDSMIVDYFKEMRRVLDRKKIQYQSAILQNMATERKLSKGLSRIKPKGKNITLINAVKNRIEMVQNSQKEAERQIAILRMMRSIVDEYEMQGELLLA